MVEEFEASFRFDHTRSEVYDHDRLEKAKGKEYTDTKRKARYSEIVIGDHVIAKRMRKNNKLTTDYSPEEYIVIHKAGGDVTIKSMESNKEYRRHVSHLKKLDQSGESSLGGEKLHNVPRVDEEPAKQDDCSGNATLSTKRSRKEPAKYKDYLPH